MLPWIKVILFSCYLITCFTITKSVNQSSFERIEIVYNTDFKSVGLRNFSALFYLLNTADGSLGAHIQDTIGKVGHRHGFPKNPKEGQQSHQTSQLKNFQSKEVKKAILNTTIPCGTNETYCDGYITDLDCVDGLCQCPNGTCWVYSTKYYGIFKYDISFTCGTCGQLGSECETDNGCDPPGTCFIDKYCHCDVGERYGSDPDVCTVFQSPTSTSLYLGALLFFLFIGLFALSYSFFANYRSTGYVIWCRDPRWSRSRRVLSRRNVTFGPPKSPAFTMDVINRNEELPESIQSEISPRYLNNSNDEAANRKMELGNPPEERHTLIDLEYTDSESHINSLQPPSVKKRRPQLLKLTPATLETDTLGQVNDKNASIAAPDSKQFDESSDTNYSKPKSEGSGREIAVDSQIEDTSGMTMYYEEYESSL